MGETKNEGTPYRIDENLIKTEEKTKYQLEKRDYSWKTAVAEVFDKTPIYKLFLVLSILIYGIIAYSKGAVGVSREDLLVLTFFLVVVLLLSCILAFCMKIYDYWDKLFENFTPLIRRSAMKIFVIVAMLLVAIILLLTFKGAIFDILQSVILKLT